MAKEKGVDLVVVIPPLVIGSLLQPTLNGSSTHIVKYLNGSVKTYANAIQVYVHVKDTALGHILIYETPSTLGRYICTEGNCMIHRSEVVEILAKFFPEYPTSSKCSEEMKPRAKSYKLSNQRLKELGMEFTLVTQCLYDIVRSLQEKGHLSVPLQRNP
ncbi:hypothetical protein TEA_020045 [Camellia sinensis var. sinensis]|uniref:Cinnamoyl-CoA reductase n=1 Tax=Camellia sinensis var. sinensis TaxID=542762 RepID=A0A4S4DY11_CAMSN|nr:hypothetical protein TEA_020045 [Camellia sinensis var. sinensis]